MVKRMVGSIARASSGTHCKSRSTSWLHTTPEISVSKVSKEPWILKEKCGLIQMGIGPFGSLDFWCIRRLLKSQVNGHTCIDLPSGRVDRHLG